MTEPAPEVEPTPEIVSPTSLPALTVVQLEDRIAKRKLEMETQACYRCGHSASSPAVGCACCFLAHTPLPDGTFKEAA